MKTCKRVIQNEALLMNLVNSRLMYARNIK
jgi:hypothetical protein